MFFKQKNKHCGVISRTCWLFSHGVKDKAVVELHHGYEMNSNGFSGIDVVYTVHGSVMYDVVCKKHSLVMYNNVHTVCI